MNESHLHDYQKTAISHILSHTHCALFLEMGLGKTVSTLTAIHKLMYEELDVSSVLVVAPKRVAESVWGPETRKWEHLQHLKISLIAGNVTQRKKALNQRADIYVIGRDNISWLVGLYGGNYLPFDMLVLDELSSFKNPKSLRFKSLRGTQPRFKRIVGLTGTPAPNGLIDLWSQIYLLDRGERLGRYLSHYRQEYFTPGQRNGHVVYSYNLKKESEKRIHNQISDICMSMKAEDYLELPGRIENIIPIVFDEKTQKKYDEFEKEQVLSLIDDNSGEIEISAINAAALSVKLLQFANGAVYDENKSFHEVHKMKIDEVKNIVDEANGNPVLIAWTFRHDMIRLKKALKKYNPVELKTDKEVQDWNNGKIQVLMMHPASGGHGLNLQYGGNIIIWFGQTWSLELEQQLNARLDRQGQTETVIIHKLVAEKTHEQDVIRAQKRKNETQNHLMESIKVRIEKYVKTR